MKKKEWHIVIFIPINNIFYTFYQKTHQERFCAISNFQPDQIIKGRQPPPTQEDKKFYAKLVTKVTRYSFSFLVLFSALPVFTEIT